MDLGSGFGNKIKLLSHQSVFWMYGCYKKKEIRFG
jgi:hypothetical protein